MHAGADIDAEVRNPDTDDPAQTPGELAELGGHREVTSVLAACRRRREAARRLERLSITGAAGGAPGTPPAPGKEVEGEADAATAKVPPVPSPPSPPGEAAARTAPSTPLAQAKDALRQEVLGKHQDDNFDMWEGIQLLKAVNAAESIDALCVLYNRLAHIERREQRSRRRGRRPLYPQGQAPCLQPQERVEAATPVFALGEKTGLNADAIEGEIKRHLDQKYHRFVNQAVNDMEFGRGKLTAGYPGLLHSSAGVAGVGSCSVFYYQDTEQNRVRVVGIGHHVDRAAYRLDYASAELGEVGKVLRIA